jgi:hypothetical protein
LASIPWPGSWWARSKTTAKSLKATPWQTGEQNHCMKNETSPS